MAVLLFYTLFYTPVCRNQHEVRAWAMQISLRRVFSSEGLASPKQMHSPQMRPSRPVPGPVKRAGDQSGSADQEHCQYK